MVWIGDLEVRGDDERKQKRVTQVRKYLGYDVRRSVRHLGLELATHGDVVQKRKTPLFVLMPVNTLAYYCTVPYPVCFTIATASESSYHPGINSNSLAFRKFRLKSFLFVCPNSSFTVSSRPNQTPGLK